VLLLKLKACLGWRNLCMRQLLLLVLLPSLAFAQPDIDPAPEIDPAPVRDSEYNPDYDTDDGDGTRIEGDLNTSNSNNGNVTNTYD